VNARPKLLIVDDGDRYVELAHRFLRGFDYATRCDRPGPCWTCPVRKGCTLTHAHDAQEADDALARHANVDAVLLDVAFDLPKERLLPGYGTLEARRRTQGLRILEQLRRRRGDLPVVLMTSREELGYEDAAERLAADEFLTLAGADAFDARALGLLVERVLARRREAPAAGGYVWGQSAAMARLRRDATALARTTLPALVVGETGTGKSALAAQVLAGRGPFVAVDLSAIPPQLAAAELFGTARGAFSGAVERPGRFERAHGGTLFLDEIGSLPLEVQRMLLTALEERQVTRLGESAARPAAVRLIAATNAELAAAVRGGAFRADLYARLNPSAQLRLPPLRERLADLEELMSAFVARTFAQGADRELLAEYAAACGLDGPLEARVLVGHVEPPRRGVAFVVPRQVLAQLRAHRWPGNVRELGLLAASAAVFALGDARRAVEYDRRARSDEARVVPLPARLVRDLLRGSPGPRTATSAPGPRKRLHDVARELERALYAQLFDECDGDFARMARRLLVGSPARNARRVQLRFNQLGLRARDKS
jgi:DNA-binding NtrC family response regulator